MGLRSALRRRVGRELRASSALREIRADVGRDHQRLDRYIERADRVRTTVDAQSRKLDKLDERVAALQERLMTVHKEVRFQATDLGRATSQVSALEARVARLEQLATDAPLLADDASAAQARSLLDEVRREHEQIRVRMQVVTWYEERLRRVEETLLQLPIDGDRRHPV